MTILLTITMVKIGADWFRQVLFENRVQQRLSRSRNKRLVNLNGDKSLQGLEVDWHLANQERMFDTFIEPARTSQPSHAYA